MRDYNLDGISSKEHQTEVYQREKTLILEQSNFKRFVADYEKLSGLEKELQLLRWIERQPILYKLVMGSYRLARRIKKS